MSNADVDMQTVTGRRPWDAEAVAAANLKQLEGLAPRQQVWISANAGTGKTEVLTRRLLTLLVADAGLSPSAILALTFTKAGAAEMAARLPRKLAELAALDDAALSAWLRENLALDGTPLQCARVRLLGPLVAAEPPLVKTIHGFAQELLQRFPEEAEVPEGFSILEGIDATRLLQEAQGVALSQASGDVAAAVDLLVGELGETGWRDLTQLTKTQWPRLGELLSYTGGVAQWREQLRAILGDAVRDDTPDEEASLVPPESVIAAVRTLYAVEDAGETRNLMEALLNAASEGDAGMLEAAWQGYLYTKGDKPRSRLFRAATAKAEPAAAEAVQAAQAAMVALRQRLAAQRTWQLTNALLVWGEAVQAAFQQLKKNQGLLDFQDLLDKAEHLLVRTDSDFRQWVLYKLDQKFRHLLVDEAQDNNRQQARLVTVLAQEFIHAREELDEGSEARTVLAVGDVKQSIYRFQGAQPGFFIRLREILGAVGDLREIDMTHSFRTTAAVLAAVDAVFARGDLPQVVQGEDKEWPTHASVYGTQAGRVEIWPLVPKPAFIQPEPWTLPMSRPQRASGVVQCAQQLAQRLVQELEAGTVLPSTGRALRPQDVLVLTQRNGVANTVMAELRAAGLPVAGGKLTLETPALQDVAALIRVLHNPEDRLSLATVLKGQIGRWDDHQLWQLSRLGSDWWLGMATMNPALAAQLATLREQAALLAPAALVGRLAQEFNIPALYGRNAVEVADLREAFDAFQEQAAGVATLTELVALLDDGIELETGHGGHGSPTGGIRVMTAHKSKGLEAPLVALLDTTRPLADLGREDRLVWLEADDGQLRGVLYRQEKQWATPLQQEAEEAEKARLRADSLRLLYVAMTRAKDCLWVAGWEARSSSRPGDSWYDLMVQGVQSLPEAATLEDGRTVFTHGEPLAAWALPKGAQPAARSVPAADALPVWAPMAWPLEEQVDAEDALAPAVGAALQRGESVHSWLMAPLAAVEAAVQAAAGPSSEAAEALAVREALPELFGPGSRGEVEVWLEQDDGEGKLGRIDRLVQGPEAWLLVDFKTERRVPETVPPAYAAQLAGYRQALQAVAGAVPVRAGIVWTAQRRVQWLTDEELAAVG